MRKTARYLAVIVIVSLLFWAGCQWQQRVAVERMSQLRVGMMLTEVTALLGPTPRPTPWDLSETEAVSVEGWSRARTTRMSWANAGENWYSVSFTPEESELLSQTESPGVTLYTWKIAGHVVLVMVNGKNEVVSKIVKPCEDHPLGKHKPFLTQMEERIRLMWK